MVIEQTVIIPADHQLHVTVPPEFPAGETATVIVLAQESVKTASPHASTRLGFLKDRVSERFAGALHLSAEKYAAFQAALREGRAEWERDIY